MDAELSVCHVDRHYGFCNIWRKMASLRPSIGFKHIFKHRQFYHIKVNSQIDLGWKGVLVRLMDIVASGVYGGAWQADEDP